MVREVDVMVYFRNLVEESGCKVFVRFEEKNIFEYSGFMEMGIRSIFSNYEKEKTKFRKQSKEGRYYSFIPSDLKNLLKFNQ